jgi:hypothetical protein
MNQAGDLAYDAFVNDSPPQEGSLPNGGAQAVRCAMRGSVSG